MIHNSEPSQLFLDTIHAAYHLEALAFPHDAAYAPGQRPVTVAGIWDQIVRMGLMKVRPFGELFAWDTRRNARLVRNRIADIAEAIRQGYVPGLRLAMNAKGREIVVHGGEEEER
jgi:hypothetical protein